jgi:hypothetical protein
MSTPLDTYLRPGGARFSESDRSASYSFEYVGPTSTLAASQPATGETWGDVPGFVTRVDPIPLGVSGHTLLTVVVEDKYGETATVGVVTEVAYELEWEPVYRPLFEHPGFNTGGSNPLTFEDLIDVGFWTDKRVYKFRDENGVQRTLSANAQRYARYVARNVESYRDFAPVARKTKTYAGGPPSSASAGAKTTLFSGFPNAPAGTWEWLKTADRGLRAAGQRNWTGAEELTGATKVLIDNTTLYLA